MDRVLKLVISFFSIIFITNSVFAANYTDLDKRHWAYEYIQKLSDEGIVVGYPDGSFHPNEYVTRAEFASMAINALKMQNYKVKEVLEFEDIPLGYWAYDQIQRAAYFDLIDSNKKTFNPDGTVTRAHAMSIVVNALTTENLSDEKAREILKQSYQDYYKIDEEYIIIAGKAAILGLIVEVPSKKNFLAADEPATRAELCAFLFKMKEEAKLNPNKKIAEAMPKHSDGIVLSNVIIEGNTATIPAGTVLPVAIVGNLSTQSNLAGEMFLGKMPDNIVTKERYLLFKKDESITGRILDVKKGILFIRNGKFNLETKTIKTNNIQTAALPAVSDLTVEHNGFWQKVWHFIIKNDKIELTEMDNDIIDIKLIKPVKVNLGNGLIIE